MKNTIILFVICAVSCTRFSPEIEAVLQQAGNNRAELETVLNHYGIHPADSLKLRAAEFLIVNMPGHWSVNNDSLNACYAEMDSILRSGMLRKDRIRQLEQISLRHPGAANMTVEDIQVIRSDYLIRNIEQAFETWHASLWARHITFDEFCEYLLPYKVTEGQPFDAWRDSLKGQFCEGLAHVRHNQYGRNSVLFASTAIMNSMRTKMKPLLRMDNTSIPLLSAGNITKLPAGSCIDYVHAVTAVMRSNGIPVTSDFVPQWPYRNGCGHSWNVLPDALRKNIVFEVLDVTTPGKLIRPLSKMGKVYRHTWAVNRDLLRMQQSGEEVPELFQNVFLKDVTSEYTPVSSVTINIADRKKRKKRYAYLSVFDNREWYPIAWGAIKRGSVRFEDMGMDIVYLPEYASDYKQEAVFYPFLLEYSGKLHYFIPDTTIRQTVVLRRKFPVFNKVFDMTMRTVGAKIEASDDADFQRRVTVHTIDEWQPSGTVLPNDSLPPYRYWRLRSANGEYCNIAELMFFRHGDTIPYKGRIISASGRRDTTYRNDKAFDNDPLTFFHSARKDSAWIGMDFEQPARIKKIICLPRSDDNNIRIGDEYELFYWGSEGWYSLGKQTATDIELSFTGVPDNALLWLRCLTRGTEERIFTYKDGEQIWW